MIASATIQMIDLCVSCDAHESMEGSVYCTDCDDARVLSMMLYAINSEGEKEGNA